MKTSIIKLSAFLLFLTIGLGHAQELIPVSEYYLGQYSLSTIFIQGQYAYLGKVDGLEILNISRSVCSQFC